MITLKNNSKSFDERISNLRNKVMQNAITLRKKIKNGTLFKFKPFSLKQKKILTWWTDKSPVKDKNGKYADLKTTFILSTTDMPATYDADNKKLTVAENSNEEAFNTYIGTVSYTHLTLPTKA